MKQKILEIKQALSLRLYNSALALALTLPSICARVEYGNKKRNDKVHYINWFDKYAKDKFTFDATQLSGNEIISYNTIDGNVCYNLRCAILHAGNFEIDNCKYKKIIIHGHNPNGKIFESEFTDNYVFHMDINRFCHL